LRASKSDIKAPFTELQSPLPLEVAINVQFSGMSTVISPDRTKGILSDIGIGEPSKGA
jgi:hypothetical protein